MVDDEPIDLEAERKARSVHADTWTAIDCLRDTIARIESGEWNPLMVYVAMLLDGDEDPARPGAVDLQFNCAGANSFEIKGLLAQHLHMQCDPNLRTEK